MGWHIRSAEAADGPALAAIYAPFVRETAVSFEEHPPDGAEMAARLGRACEELPFLVAEEGGGVLGYAYASAYRARAAYRFSAEVSVYVSGDARGRGVARGLYGALLGHLAGRGVRSAIAIIALPNDASVAFHEAMGFEARGVLRDVGRKFEAWHDTGFWQKML